MKKKTMKAYLVSYTLVPQKKLDSLPTTKWKRKWFVTSRVKATSMRDAVRKVKPKTTIYNAQPTLISKLPRSRSDNVNIISFGKVVRMRKKKK